MLGANVFPYYDPSKETEDGDEYYHQIFVGDPEGKPFIVRVGTEGWRPLNVIIFASSEEDAIKRVNEGLRKVTELEQSEYSKIRYERILELFDVGTVEASPFDKKYVCKLGWDTRGLS